MQGWERAINTLSVRIPQTHNNTNPQNERIEREMTSLPAQWLSAIRKKNS